MPPIMPKYIAIWTTEMVNIKDFTFSWKKSKTKATTANEDHTVFFAIM